jgi:3-keto-L-gulonate-6-phosphate decarboxylase
MVEAGTVMITRNGYDAVSGIKFNLLSKNH